jgi:hypothetical protein
MIEAEEAINLGQVEPKSKPTALTPFAKHRAKKKVRAEQ